MKCEIIDDTIKDFKKYFDQFPKDAMYKFIVQGNVPIDKPIVWWDKTGWTLESAGDQGFICGCDDLPVMLEAQRCANLKVAGVSFHGEGRAGRGIKFLECHGAILDECYITAIGNVQKNFVHGAMIESCNDFTATRNTISEINTKSSASGMTLTTGKNTPNCMNPYVARNLFFEIHNEADADGIRVHGRGESSAGVIEHNGFVNCHKRAVKNQTNGMIIQNNRMGGFRYAGIDCQEGNNNDVTGNFLHGGGSAPYGIYLWADTVKDEAKAVLNDTASGNTVCNCINGITVYGRPDHKVKGEASILNNRILECEHPIRIYADDLELLRVQDNSIDCPEARGMIAKGGYWSDGHTFKPIIREHIVKDNYRAPGTSRKTFYKGE